MRRALALGVVAALAAFVVWATQHFAWTLDDAFISFAYARNWARGDGVVFNAGEYVEGYTCFLWVALSALGIHLGFDAIEWAHWLASGFAALSVLGAYALARVLDRDQVASCLAAAITATFVPLLIWSASGMEVALFACLLVWSVAAHIRGSMAAPVLLGLLSLTRPEGWLLTALFCLDALRRDWRSGLRYSAIAASIVVPWFGWRVWYYGDLLPNTFRAKVGGDPVLVIERGVRYVGNFLADGGGAGLLGLGLAGLVLSARRSLAALLFALGFVAYVIAVGGDVFPHYRFLAVLAPLLSAYAMTVAPTRAAALIVAAVLIAEQGPAFRRVGEIAVASANSERLGAEVCRYLEGRLHRGASVAAVGIGYPKWCLDTRVIDMVGLTDKRIARAKVPMGGGLPGHERYDADYVMSLRPNYIVASSPEEKGPFVLPAVRALWSHPVLRSEYMRDRYGYVRVPVQQTAR